MAYLKWIPLPITADLTQLRLWSRLHTYVIGRIVIESSIPCPISWLTLRAITSGQTCSRQKCRSRAADTPYNPRKAEIAKMYRIRDILYLRRQTPHSQHRSLLAKSIHSLLWVTRTSAMLHPLVCPIPLQIRFQETSIANCYPVCGTIVFPYRNVQLQHRAHVRHTLICQLIRTSLGHMVPTKRNPTRTTCGRIWPRHRMSRVVKTQGIPRQEPT